ncbi:hypothetical protein K7472_19280 [Streptomyces sp. PTM05]|uniref:Uncharacterized protein n=1 Tax=Streptantibioticus parmotrematis TaxID=2873249 RepID=A0ABS7QVP8_9ACTN|nr:hypothetical protein [Streptantibioticus parmotrematis]MBY8886983.1 hypothetical protein [Streptantibioticus parmotrematis]
MGQLPELPGLDMPLFGGQAAPAWLEKPLSADWISQLPATAGPPSPWWREIVRDGVPAPKAPWKAGLIPAGVWLYRGTPSVRDATFVAQIPADQERLAVVVAGMGPDPDTFDAMARVLSVLPEDCPRAVRIFLPSIGPVEGRAFAREHQLDLVAPSGPLRGTGGITYVSGPPEMTSGAFWQWYRVSPGRAVQSVGALYPTPTWETALTRHDHLAESLPAVLNRVPAGYAMRPLGAPSSRFAAFAARVPPAADRLQVVVDGRGLDPLLLAACTQLLSALPPEATHQVQLDWPYAGVRESTEQLEELASLLDAPVYAPAAALDFHANGRDLLAVHDDGGLGHWVRFSPTVSPQPHGPLSPPPAWGRALRAVLDTTPDDSPLASAPAGLHMRIPSRPDVDRAAAALPPDRDGMTVLADGDATCEEDQQRVLSVLETLPPELLQNLRVVMTFATVWHRGGPPFGQLIADRLRRRVLVADAASVVSTECGGAEAQRLGEPSWNRYLPRPELRASTFTFLGAQ